MTKGVVAGIFAPYVGRRLEDDVGHSPPETRRIAFSGTTGARRTRLLGGTADFQNKSALSDLYC